MAARSPALATTARSGCGTPRPARNTPSSRVTKRQSGRSRSHRTSRTLASARDDGTVCLWDGATGAQLAIVAGDKVVFAVAFAPDGRTLASGGRDGTVRLWCPATGAQRTILRGHQKAVRSVAFSPDGRTLASVSEDGTVRLWDPSTGAQRTILRGHPNLAVSWLGHLGAGQNLLDILVHGMGVRTVGFSPDGRTLADASADGTVRLWKRGRRGWHRLARGLTRRRATATLRGGRPGIVLAFSPDASTLLSAGRPRDDTVWTWDTSKGALIHKANIEVNVNALAWDASGIALGTDSGVVVLEPVESTTRG